MPIRPASLALALALAGCAAPPSPVTSSSHPRGPSPAPSSGGATSAVHEQGDYDVAAAPGLKGALDLYQRKDLEGAAIAFYAALESPAGRTKPELSVAQFFLAKALERRGLRASSLGFFDAISREPSHAFFHRAVFWLARLADEMPDDELALKAIGRYSSSDIGRNAPAQPDALTASARYYIGRAYYNRGDFGRAITALRAVPEGSRWALHARFFEGMSQIRDGDADASIRSFRAAALGAGGAVAAGVPEAEAARLHDLAWLALARTYYSSARGDDPDDASLAGSDRLRLALDAYERVTSASGYQDDALLEQAWAYVRLGDTSRARASLDALSAPFVQRTPEAHSLRILVAYSRCELDKASQAITALRRDYGDDGKRTGEVELLGREVGDAARGEGKERAPSGGEASPELRAVITSALEQRDTRRKLDLLTMIKAEKELLSAAPPSFQGSPLGARIKRDLDRISTATSEQVSAIVRARCDRFAKESREEIDKANQVAIEIESVRGGISSCAPRKPSN
jgi:tetratricopeptide (TPR) repeat protein